MYTASSTGRAGGGGALPRGRGVWGSGGAKGATRLVAPVKRRCRCLALMRNAASASKVLEEYHPPFRDHLPMAGRAWLAGLLLRKLFHTRAPCAGVRGASPACRCRRCDLFCRRRPPARADAIIAPGSFCRHAPRSRRIAITCKHMSVLEDVQPILSCSNRSLYGSSTMISMSKT